MRRCSFPRSNVSKIPSSRDYCFRDYCGGDCCVDVVLACCGRALPRAFHVVFSLQCPRAFRRRARRDERTHARASERNRHREHRRSGNAKFLAAVTITVDTKKLITYGRLRRGETFRDVLPRQISLGLRGQLRMPSLLASGLCVDLFLIRTNLRGVFLRRMRAIRKFRRTTNPHRSSSIRRTRLSKPEIFMRSREKFVRSKRPSKIFTPRAKVSTARAPTQKFYPCSSKRTRVSFPQKLTKSSPRSTKKFSHAVANSSAGTRCRPNARNICGTPFARFLKISATCGNARKRCGKSLNRKTSKRGEHFSAIFASVAHRSSISRKACFSEHRAARLKRAHAIFQKRGEAVRKRCRNFRRRSRRNARGHKNFSA